MILPSHILSFPLPRPVMFFISPIATIHMTLENAVRPLARFLGEFERTRFS
jgi:hypothetical protein